MFDNADDVTALGTAWPRTTHGSVLVTTRDFAVAANLPAQYLQINTMSYEDGSEMLLKAVGIDQASPSDQEDALAISKALGGLPLALAQIGGFITQRKLHLRDFLPLYERNTAKIDARKPSGGDYEHTLGTVWNVSFEKLSDHSIRLLTVLSLLDPDSVAEEVILQGSRGLDGPFSFLSDEMELVSRPSFQPRPHISNGPSFGDALEELLRVALVNRAASDAVLSIHRLVQSAALRRVDELELTRHLDVAVHILSLGFPSHSGEDIGHQIGAWKRCEKVLPHVYHLVEVVKRPRMRPGDRQKYAELLLRCSWWV